MENIEDIIGLLPPARQQAARRQLAKLAEENPHKHLLFELTLLKLIEVQRNVNATSAKSVEVVRTVENPAINAPLERKRSPVHLLPGGGNRDKLGG